MGNMFNCTCNRSNSQLDILDKFWRNIKLRHRYAVDFVKSLELKFNLYRTNQINIDELYKRIINEFLTNEDDNFKSGSKKYFLNHFQSHTHLLKEILFGMVFLCKPTEFIEKIIKCFVSIDKMLMQKQEKNIQNEEEDEHEIFDRRIIQQYDDENKYYISKKSLGMILNIYISSITTDCLEYIFEKDEDLNEIKNNLESNQEKYISKILNHWMTADVVLDDFLLLNYEHLIKDQDIRNELISMSLNDQREQQMATPTPK